MINQISQFVWHEEFMLIQIIITEELGKIKIKFIKIPLSRFTNKTRNSKSPLNTTAKLTKEQWHSQIKTSCFSF